MKGIFMEIKIITAQEGIEPVTYLEHIKLSDFDNEEILIFKEINKLKPIYRDIIYLYYYQGYKIKEISIILKMKENTVSSNLTRAREKLKTILEDGGVINVK